MLETARLRLRDFQPSDLDAFAKMNADPCVMRYFPAPLTRAETADMMARIAAHRQKHGFALYALESDDAAFIGFSGLMVVDFAAPFTPAVEIGWRLARVFWRQGLASEAARAVLAQGFGELALDEIVSFTTRANQPSRRVMEKLTMLRDHAGDFNHPMLAVDSPLRRHVLYRISRRDWQAQQANGREK